MCSFKPSHQTALPPCLLQAGVMAINRQYEHLSGFGTSSWIPRLLHRISGRLDQKHGSQAMLLVVEVLLVSNSQFVYVHT